MPRFDFDDLESQLVEYDTFIEVLEEYVKRKTEEEGQFTIENLVHWIRSYGIKGDIFSMLIQGLSGSGKTTLALKIGAYYLFNFKKNKPSYRQALKYTVFDPFDVLNIILKHLEQRKKVPIIIMDDAGSWLSKFVRTLDKTAFLEFYNLLRSSVNTLIFTDIWSIDKYIRDTVKIRALVRKIPQSQYENYGIPRDTRVEWSIASLYAVQLTINGPVKKKLTEIIYPLELPDYVRRAYEEERRKYTTQLAIRVFKRMVSSKSGLEQLESRESGRRLLKTIADIVNIGSDGE